jgi:hypothetical protein
MLMYCGPRCGSWKPRKSLESEKIEQAKSAEAEKRTLEAQKDLQTLRAACAEKELAAKQLELLFEQGRLGTRSIIGNV